MGAVATHDNPIINISTEDPMRLAVIDADRVLVMHFLSFWKDWIGKEDPSLISFFRSRLTHFYDENDSLPWNWWKIPRLSEKEREKLVAARKPPYTDLGRQWRDKQFKARWQEIQANIIKDEATFREYAEEHLRKEIEHFKGQAVK